MDFDDLLFNTVLMLQKVPQLAVQLASRFQFVVVDEYQDTNDVQYELLKLLINEQRNVTVVGDDDQSIYGWRGANIRNILDFEKDFPDIAAKVMTVEPYYQPTHGMKRRIESSGKAIIY